MTQDASRSPRRAISSEAQVKDMIDQYLQEDPDYFTIVYVAADD